MKPSSIELFMSRRLVAQSIHHKMNKLELGNAVAQLLADYREDIITRVENGTLPDDLKLPPKKETP